ncbi:diacylglycerol/lipid kinase family protein [Egbenema bharatensis]|uniref:diacylglycerol/lipid kinase family protein n=1 Tax=Egbenema bharatensis TaxID=3463334 RepID=UPI003A8556BC
MQVTLIHNPGAGDSQISGDELTQLIRQAGHAVTYQSAKDDRWETVLEDPGDLIVVAGGDGTVGKVAKRLIGRSVPMAILPLGTANNIVKTLGFADDTPIEDLIHYWSTAQLIPFDVAEVNSDRGSSYLIESLGAGLFASMMAEAENNPVLDRFNSQSEIKAILQMLQTKLKHYAPKSFSLCLDEQVHSGEYIFLEVMNIKSVSSNVDLAPEANPGDGLLDVVLFTESDRPLLDEYLAQRLAGQHHLPQLTIHRAKQIQIQGQDFKLHIDDKVETASHGTPTAFTIDINVIPQALQFLVPLQDDQATGDRQWK